VKKYTDVKRIVLGEGYFPSNLEIRFYCGLPVWEHHPRMVVLSEYPELSCSKIRMVAEILPIKRCLAKRPKRRSK
jgi:hypothetical protein